MRRFKVLERRLRVQKDARRSSGGVSRSGMIPEPTVTVRMEENEMEDGPLLRLGLRIVRPDSGSKRKDGP